MTYQNEIHIKSVWDLSPSQRKVFEELIEIDAVQGIDKGEVVRAFYDELVTAYQHKRRMLLNQVLRRLGIDNECRW